MSTIYINPALPGMISNLWKSDPSENSVRTALKLAGDLIQELIDLKAAPVLPSSGVDEDKLAEVERAAAARALEEAARATESEAPSEPHAGATFTAHAEWLSARAAEIRERGKSDG